MIRRFSITFAVLSVFFDWLVVMLALWTAVEIRPLVNFPPLINYLPLVQQLPNILFPLFGVIWVLIFALFGQYDRRKYLSRESEIRLLTIASGMATLVCSGALYLSFRDVSRFLFIVFSASAYIYSIGWRAAYRILLRDRGRFSSKRNVLVIGSGEIARMFWKTVNRHKQSEITIIATIDNDEFDKEIRRGLATARELIREEGVHDVVFAMPGTAYRGIIDLAATFYDLPVRVWVIPDYFSASLYRADIEEFGGVPMLNLRAPALNDIQRMIKRAFDLLVAVAILPPSLVIMTIVSLLIKMDGPGTILFVQSRVGENGRLFNMLKFRTMSDPRSDHQVEGSISFQRDDPPVKKPDDPRVTRVGKILRRTSLDELPQLLNVLLGDMSLVGPRPELPQIVAGYETWQMSRFAVPPGITGWWQITGRSDKPMHLNTEDDLYYLRNYSLSLDISILLRTFWVVIKGNGAY